eukprot:scaffold1171_cov108-Isochrysis_galbana.AAC.3
MQRPLRPCNAPLSIACPGPITDPRSPPSPLGIRRRTGRPGCVPQDSSADGPPRIHKQAHAACNRRYRPAPPSLPTVARLTGGNERAAPADKSRGAPKGRQARAAVRPPPHRYQVERATAGTEDGGRGVTVENVSFRHSITDGCARGQPCSG